MSVTPIPVASEPRTVDVNVPRFNQAVVAVVTAVAFVVREPALVGLVFAVLVISALWPSKAPLSKMYTELIRSHIENSKPIALEPAAPPQFAQKLGAGVLGVALVAFLTGVEWAGWAATLVVTILAALAATTRICLGCILYERLVAH